MTEADNSAVAALVRDNLKQFGLDIPGTDEGYAVNELYQRLITTEKIITIRVHRGIPTIRFWMTGHTLQIRMN